MGGMAVLEWPLCTPPGFVRHIIPLATSARHSAWCISWGEAQRQSIYSDPDYEDGYYQSGKQPQTGMGAARMAALLTYRSRDSFESRFGRKPQKTKDASLMTPPKSPAEEALASHNDGHKNAKHRPPRSSNDSHPIALSPVQAPPSTSTTPPPSSCPPVFSAQSYLRYQGEKFTSRFDANCYIHITRKLIRTTSRGADSMGWLRLMDRRHWRLSSRPCLPAHWLLASKRTGYLQYPSNANWPNTFPTRSSLSSILLTDTMGFCSSSSKSTHISCAF